MGRIRGRSHRRGQAIVEFALAAPIFFLILFILIDFGRVIYIQNAITQAADSAARFGSTSAPQTDAAIRSHARVTPINLPDSAIQGQAGGAFYPGGTTPGQRVYVEITLPIPLLTPFVSDIVGGTITVRAHADELIR